MREVLALGAGLVLICSILLDAFEAIVLPRRVTRRFRPTRLFYALTWRPWAALARRMDGGKRREAFLGVFGPLSMIVLLGCWALGLVLGFGLLHWAAERAAGHGAGFPTRLYLSGTTFFTLGLGDVTPSSPAARVLTVVEAGIGFGFLALVIGYLPVLYGAFSKREVSISLLDARAGSPPSALELLRRFGSGEKGDELKELLRDFEVWTAELMESHLSYPVLCYYRSQHDNQSWLAALTTVLDACALLRASARTAPTPARAAAAAQARFTFAIARHAAVDRSQVLGTRPRAPERERLPADVVARLHGALAEAGVPPEEVRGAAERLRDYRHLYEPYVNALAGHLLMELPRFDGTHKTVENWRTSAWEKIANEPGVTAADPTVDDEHAS
jgi:hypothetical protein